MPQAMTVFLHPLFSAWGTPPPGYRAATTDAAFGPNLQHSDPDAPGLRHGRAAFPARPAPDAAGFLRNRGRQIRRIGFPGMGEPA